VDPDCSYCKVEGPKRSGELRDDDRVLSWTRGDHEGGAVRLLERAAEPFRGMILNDLLTALTRIDQSYEPRIVRTGK
jgi:hypothetical protein